jgi:hypothetical protein
MIKTKKNITDEPLHIHTMETRKTMSTSTILLNDRNYPEWSQQIKNSLKTKGLWRIVTGEHHQMSKTARTLSTLLQQIKLLSSNPNQTTNTTFNASIGSSLNMSGTTEGSCGRSGEWWRWTWLFFWYSVVWMWIGIVRCRAFDGLSSTLT